MPLYEYAAEDGTVIELLRPIADADKPVADPDGRGRVFTRRASTFAAQGGTPGVGKGAGHTHLGACCPCGKSAGSCSRPA